MPNSRDDNGIALLVVVGAVVVAIAIWYASTALGLEPATGFGVAGRLMVPVLLTICFGLSEHWFELARLGNTWPIVLGSAWWSIWPAIDDWGGKAQVGDFVLDVHTAWWSADWLKWSVLAVILAGGGYAIWRKNRW